MPGDDDAPGDAPDSGTPAPGPGPGGAPPPSPADMAGAPGGASAPGASVLPPSSAPTAQPGIQALGAQAVLRNQLKVMVQALHTYFSPKFMFNSPEGKAIHKALSALGPVFGGDTPEQKTDRTGAMAALMARQAQRPAAAMPGGPAGGPPQLPRGPAPSPQMGGGGM